MVMGVWNKDKRHRIARSTMNCRNHASTMWTSTVISLTTEIHILPVNEGMSRTQPLSFQNLARTANKGSFQPGMGLYRW